MDDLAVRVEGAREIRRAIRQAEGKGKAELVAIHKDAATSVAEQARRKVPTRTGRLQRTIRPNGSVARASVSAGGARALHGRPVHSGVPSRGIRPTPFVTDAVSEQYPAIVRDIEQRYGDLAESIFE